MRKAFSFPYFIFLVFGSLDAGLRFCFILPQAEESVQVLGRHRGTDVRLTEYLLSQEGQKRLLPLKGRKPQDR